MDSLKRVLILLFSTLALLFWLVVIYFYFAPLTRNSSGIYQGIFIALIPTLLSIGWNVRLWLGGMRKDNLNITLLGSFILLLSVPFSIWYNYSTMPWD